jgi:hypothetical protein
MRKDFMTRAFGISSIQSRDDGEEAFPQPGSIDRRSRNRFPLELPVRYRTLGRGPAFTGVGWVRNMSSGGVLVGYKHEVSPGTRMELNIEWPSLLDGRVPLRLVMVGKVVRCESSSFAMELARYQFRTTRKAVVPIDGGYGDSGKQMEKKLATA